MYTAFMADITNELLYEVLKTIQPDLADVKAMLADHTRQFLRLCDDINDLRSDDVRLEGLQVQMDTRLARIEKRLDLTDA